MEGAGEEAETSPGALSIIMVYMRHQWLENNKLQPRVEDKKLKKKHSDVQGNTSKTLHKHKIKKTAQIAFLGGEKKKST